MKIPATSLLLLAVAFPGAAVADSIEHIHPASGSMSQTHDQKTVICPVINQDLYEGHVQYGPRTRFVVKNTATKPVVVSFVERNGTEYSAANTMISPAILDPDAFLAPGVTKVFAVQEGHVFHVRDSVTRELLMQHRAGIVPVENRYNREIASCPPSAATEEEDEPDRSFRVMRKFSQWTPLQVDRFNEEVHVDIGFHNTVKSQDGTSCPVNFYYVRKENFGSTRPPQFMERIALQLGDNHLSTAKDDSGSSTKYERTYLGHQFVARLAHDENVVVDYLSVGPIKVQDCSLKKKNTVKSVAHSEAIVIPVGKHTKLGDGVNQTQWGNVAHLLNTTFEGRRELYFKMYTE